MGQKKDDEETEAVVRKDEWKTPGACCLSECAGQDGRRRGGSKVVLPNINVTNHKHDERHGEKGQFGRARGAQRVTHRQEFVLVPS